MKRIIFLASWVLALVFSVTSCMIDLDGGPYESDTRTFNYTGFDRLDMGSAFTITVRPGSQVDIQAEGNRRDLDDLDVYTRNGTLYARYRNYGRVRRYNTRFVITMPALRSVNFSGASKASVGRFRNISTLDVKLSGASQANIDADATRLYAELSGASKLDIAGVGEELNANVSGVSALDAYSYPVRAASVDLSGASSVKVLASQRLEARAGGGSSVRFRGNPAVSANVSGGSSIRPD